MLRKGSQLATADEWQSLSGSGAARWSLLQTHRQQVRGVEGNWGGGECSEVLGTRGTKFWVPCLGKERMQTRTWPACSPPTPVICP